MDWRFAAACRPYDPELFFPVSPYGTTAERQVAEAKAVCVRCPVRAECLDFALTTQQAHGVWGGMSEQELVLLRRHNVRPADTDADERRQDGMRATEPSAPEGFAREPRGGLPAAG
ncbi:MAG: WhiB family transcriptional regulator [Actinobacteria bacterium]|nr:WhiB family transcriptional regulator [Actinomycetota bacterium]MBO0834031.1 WhiB family transcriptional regulator [Actinomycetota bacterium]